MWRKNLKKRMLFRRESRRRNRFWPGEKASGKKWEKQEKSEKVEKSRKEAGKSEKENGKRETEKIRIGKSAAAEAAAFFRFFEQPAAKNGRPEDCG